MSKKFFDIIPPKIPSSSFSFERKDEEKPQLSVEGEVLKTLVDDVNHAVQRPIIKRYEMGAANDSKNRLVKRSLYVG